MTLFCLSRHRRKTPGTSGFALTYNIASWTRAGAFCLVVAIAPMVFPGSSVSQAAQAAYPFHSPAPAGYNVILLKPSRTEVSILGVVECPEMEGAQRVSEGVTAYIISADGVPMKHYPVEVSFRVTATLRKTVLDPASETIVTDYDPRVFLQKLGFKLKVYHGLDKHEIFPQSVKMIGMPEDVPYDERVFRVSFELENIPVTDRMVLEIFSPDNQLLTHFTFGLL